MTVKLVTNTFGLRYPPPTSIQPLGRKNLPKSDATVSFGLKLVEISYPKIFQKSGILAKIDVRIYLNTFHVATVNYKYSKSKKKYGR